MPRISAETQLINPEKYAKFYPDYQNQLKQLITKYKTVDSPEYGDKVTFEQNKTSVRHRWFEYKQGFSPTLIELFISETSPPRNTMILDPFTGVGTTNLVAQQFGYRSIGFDVNPVAAFAATVKTTHYNQSEIQEITQKIAQFKPIMSTHPVCYRLILTSFDPAVLDQL